MKLIVLGVLCISLLLLIYVVNFTGLAAEAYIPLNPMTIGTVMVLGLPGVALLIGLKFTILGS